MSSRTWQSLWITSNLLAVSGYSTDIFEYIKTPLLICREDMPGGVSWGNGQGTQMDSTCTLDIWVWYQDKEREILKENRRAQTNCDLIIFVMPISHVWGGLKCLLTWHSVIGGLLIQLIWLIDMCNPHHILSTYSVPCTVLDSWEDSILAIIKVRLCVSANSETTLFWFWRSLLWVSSGQAADEYLQVWIAMTFNPLVTDWKYPVPQGKTKELLMKWSNGAS